MLLPLGVVIEINLAMDLLKGTLAASTGENGSRQVKKAKASEDIQYKDSFSIISKLAPNSAMQVRIHKAIATDCYKVLAARLWFTFHSEATRSFATAQSTLKEEGESPQEVKEMFGMPSIHWFSAMVKHVMPLRIQEVQKLKTAVALWGTREGWTTIAQHIRCCRFSKMSNAQEKRLEISVPMEMHINVEEEDHQKLIPTWAWLVVKREMLKESSSHHQMEGAAPPGDMERKIQERLDANK